MLRLPRSQGRFRLYTDWSKDGISAILHQVHEDGEHPVAYKSRGCRGAETNYASAEGELLAAVWGIGKLRQYLGGKEFTLVTDSSALTGLQTSKNISGKIARWALYLADMNFTVEHRAGKKHGNADGVSRGPHAPEQATE